MLNDKVYCSCDDCQRYMLQETGAKRWGSVHFSMICGKHWRRLTRSERRVWSRIKRARLRLDENDHASMGVHNDREARIWRALTRRAGSDDRLFAALEREGL